MFREMTRSDFELFWTTFERLIKAEETYAFDASMNFEESYDLWCKKTLKTFVLLSDGKILGSYYLKPNAMGPSNHICNCGYIVETNSQGIGVARRMCEYSQETAVTLGLKLCNSIMLS